MAKRWFGTSHRSVTPRETLARFERFAPALGITRLANLTGLDYLGIPVFAAMRPNARCLSVHQGKGLDIASARVSAFMEAAEFDHAERIATKPVVFAPKAPPGRIAIADPDRLPRQAGKRLARDRPIAWLGGRDLMTRKAVLVPRALVAIDFTQASDPFFVESTDGLASGNSLDEAIVSGLTEVIERDATALWRLRSARERAQRRVSLATVSGKARGLIARLRRAAIAVSVWDITTDIGVASFLCRIREDSQNTRSDSGAFFGAGCHPSRDVALCRAITEAAQTRLTYISGARDDLLRHDYGDGPRQVLTDSVLDLWEQRQPGRSLRDIPDMATESIEGDLAYILARLKACGFGQAIAVDLTRPVIGIPVVRVVVPGLEVDDPLAHRGSRARSVGRGAG